MGSGPNLAAGVAAGIKSSGRPDLSLVATADHRPVTAAGVFTTNLVAAAPVQLSRRHLAAEGRAAAVVLNSGNANAATGQPGLLVSEATADLAARALGCDRSHVLVCSTGLIGIPLPIEPFTTGVPAAEIGVAGGDQVACGRRRRRPAAQAGSGLPSSGQYRVPGGYVFEHRTHTMPPSAGA